MITQSESGLSSPDYNALKAARVFGKYELVAHRYNPVFSSVHGPTANTGTFDAVVHNGYVIRARPTATDRYDPTGVTVTTNTFTPPSGTITSLSLASNATTLYLFYATTTGIYVATSTDDGTSFGAWTTITTAAENLSAIISAASHTELHFFAATNTALRHLKVALNTGSWAITSSEIYLTRVPTSFQAKPLSSGQTAIVMTVSVPGHTTSRYINNSVRKIAYNASGLLSFVYKSGVWGDHYDIEIVDDAKPWRFRRDATMTVIDGKCYVVASAATGPKSDQYVTGYRMYTSKDGITWSNGLMLTSLSNDNSRGGVKILRLGDYVYAVQVHEIRRSTSTLMFGHSPSSVQIDLTDLILEGSAEIAEGRQSSVTLDNADDSLSSSFLVSEENTSTLIWRYGFDIPGTGEKDIQVSIEEVDSVALGTYKTGKKAVFLTARDRMSWISDQNQSEQAHYWQSQMVGGDQFLDHTESGYGGLAHTAVMTGSWKTSPNNYLYLSSSNQEGIAFSTFGDSEIWNGHVQTGIELSQLANSEYAGVVFRAVDKDNLWAAIYNQASDTIQLTWRRGGGVAFVAESSVLSWSDDLDVHYIRAEFNYGQIKVFSSDDAVTWTLRITFLMFGITDEIDSESDAANAQQLEKGYVGVIGKGFSDEDQIDNFELDPFDFGDFDFDWSDWMLDFGDFPYLYQPLDLDTPLNIEDPAGNAGGIYITTDEDDKVQLTVNFFEAGEDWTDITPESGITYEHAIFDHRQPKTTGAYVLGNDGTSSWVWYTPNVFKPVVTWRKGAAINGVYKMIRLIGKPGHLHVYRPAGVGGGWSHTFDFVPDNRDFSPVSYSVNPSANFYYGQLGQWINGQGWSYTDRKPTSSFQNGFYRGLFVWKQGTPDATTVVTELKLTYDFVAGINIGQLSGFNTGVFVAEVSQQTTEAGAGSFFFFNPGGAFATGTGATHTWTGSLNWTAGVPYLAIRIIVDYWDDFNNPSSHLEGSARLKKIEISGTGTDPFADDPGAASAAVRFSKNHGLTFGEPIAVGDDGFTGDTSRIGNSSYYSSVSKIRRAANPAGPFVDYITAPGGGQPRSILIPWYRLGSTVLKNYGLAKPDMVYASDSSSGGQTIYKVKNGVATGITPAGTPVGYSPNGLAMWKGKKIAALLKASGTPHLYTSTTTGASWTDRGAVSNATYLRIRRFNGNGDAIVIANGTSITYSKDFGATLLTKSAPGGATLKTIEPYG